MKLDPINLIGGFYQDDNLPWSAQDTVNWIPRPAEAPGTLSPMKLAGAPGLRFLADIDTDPVRVGGIHNAEGRLFVVAGTTLYEVHTDYTTTVRGTIPGAGPVTMQHNQLEFGNELSIGNGSGSLYVWNTWTNTFTVVADDAATGSIQTVYLNRRLIHMDPFGRFLYPSEIDNALAYDALDRSDSEASPDKFVGLGVSQFELVGFSQRTIEFYADTGATEQPFRPKKIAINRGCASRQSIVNVGGTLAWLGDDGIFYRLNGYREEAISPGPINVAIAQDNLANCFGIVWEDRKHDVAYWTLPDGKTWGWDSWTNLWHRRESFGLNRWRINAVEKWNDLWIAGDFQRGRLYAMDWETYHENGDPLIASRTAPPIYNNGNKVVCPLLELVFDTGRGSVPPLVVSGDLSGGFVGQTGTASYSATGGIGPYTFSISSGSLPTGATMGPDGVVTYTYTVVGSYSWTVRVTDAFGNMAEHADTALVTDEVVWFLSWENLPVYLSNAKFSGDVWTTGPGTVGHIGYLYKSPDGILHCSSNSVGNYSYSQNNGVNWTAANRLNSGSGRMVFGGGFYFSAGGLQVMQRRTAPNGAWTSPSASTVSRASDACYLNGRLSAVYHGDGNNSRVKYSDDHGVNWSLGGQFNTETTASAIRIGSDGVSRLVLCYDIGAPGSYLCRIKTSDDNGATWSASRYSFPSPASNNVSQIVFHVTGERWVVATSGGRIAYSSDNGNTWSAGATLGDVPQQIAFVGGRLMCCCLNGLLYSSDDFGATWNLRADPAGVGNITGVMAVT